MAATTRRNNGNKRKTVVKVELSWGGLLSLAVVAFCIFLWMFLLGLWAGQTILTPAETAGEASQVNLWERRVKPADYGRFIV